jgi:hypothetical protein
MLERFESQKRLDVAVRLPTDRKLLRGEPECTGDSGPSQASSVVFWLDMSSPDVVLRLSTDVS